MHDIITDRYAGTVVIAVGSPLLLSVLASSVEEAHYRVLTCNDSRELESSIRADRPIAIILDPDMQGGRGLAAARRIKTCTDTAEIPILFLIPRAVALPAFAWEFDARSTGYLTVPLGRGEVAAMLDHLRGKQVENSVEPP